MDLVFLFLIPCPLRAWSIMALHCFFFYYIWIVMIMVWYIHWLLHNLEFRVYIHFDWSLGELENPVFPAIWSIAGFMPFLSVFTQNRTQQNTWKVWILIWFRCLQTLHAFLPPQMAPALFPPYWKHKKKFNRERALWKKAPVLVLFWTLQTWSFQMLFILTL